MSRPKPKVQPVSSTSGDAGKIVVKKSKANPRRKIEQHSSESEEYMQDSADDSSTS